MTEHANTFQLDDEPINFLEAFYIGRLEYGSFSVIQNQDGEILLFLTEEAALDFAYENLLEDCFIHPAMIGNIRRQMKALLVKEELHLSQIEPAA